MLERSRKARLIALIAAGFLLMGADCAWSQSAPSLAQPQNEQPEQDQADQAADQEPTDVSAGEQIAEYTFWLTILTGIVAISTAGLWILGIYTAIRQLRAYLMPEAVTVRVGNNGITIKVTIKNFGQTPAGKVSTWTAIHVTPDDMPEPHIEPSTFSVGPGSTFELTEASQIGEDAINALISDHRVATFRAKIVYRDTFGCRRHTDMQGRLRRKRGQWDMSATRENNGYS